MERLGSLSRVAGPMAGTRCANGGVQWGYVRRWAETATSYARMREGVGGAWGGLCTRPHLRKRRRRECAPKDANDAGACQHGAREEAQTMARG